jgi:hypothetical protein
MSERRWEKQRISGSECTTYPTPPSRVPACTEAFVPGRALSGPSSGAWTGTRLRIGFMLHHLLTRPTSSTTTFVRPLAWIPAGAGVGSVASFFPGELIPSHERSEPSRFQFNPFEQDR